MELQVDYFGALLRNWKVFVVVLIATLAATFIATAMQTPVYESSAQLVVAPSSAPMDTADVIRSVETLERRTIVATFARMPGTPDVHAAVLAQLNVPREKTRGLKLHGSVVPSTNIIRIDARGSDPVVTARAANLAAAMTARNAATLYRVYELRFLARATPARRAVHPEPRRNALVGLIVGLVLGIGAALASERLRTRSVKSEGP